MRIARLKQFCANSAKYILWNKEYCGEREEKMASNLKGGMVLITCECGKQILLIPNVTAMSRAIEDHAAKHESGKGQATQSASKSS